MDLYGITERLLQEVRPVRLIKTFRQLEWPMFVSDAPLVASTWLVVDGNSYAISQRIIFYNLCVGSLTEICLSVTGLLGRRQAYWCFLINFFVCQQVNIRYKLSCEQPIDNSLSWLPPTVGTRRRERCDKDSVLSSIKSSSSNDPWLSCSDNHACDLHCNSGVANPPPAGKIATPW